MPSKKKKYNARFPAGRIKKIMQTDEEVGKVAQAVPVIISRTLELFVESLLTKSIQITQARNAKTLTPSHMKQCILSESRFDFLKDLVKNIPDATAQEDNDSSVNELCDFASTKFEDQDHQQQPEIVANFYTEQSTSSSRTPVIQFNPKVKSTKHEDVITEPTSYTVEPKVHIDLRNAEHFSMAVSNPISQIVVPTEKNKASSAHIVETSTITTTENIPPLAPLSSTFYGQNDNLLIDEDYDN